MLYNGAQAKTPLSGVIVSTYGAASVISDDQGQFTLQFRVMHAGDKVNVRRIEKVGYEVFNTEALEQWNISSNNRHYQVVLCETATLNRLRDKYRQAATQACSDRLTRQEAHEEAQRQQGLITEEEYQQRINQLEEEHERQLDKIDSYVDRIARIDLSEISQEERAIIALIEQGKFDEAIEAYDKLQLVEKYRTERKSVQQLAEAKKKIEQVKEQHETVSDNLFQAALRQVHLLRMTGGKENNQKARDVLTNFYWADSTQVRPALHLGDFLIDHHDYEEADRTLRAVLPHCRNWQETALIKSRRASLLTTWHQYDEAQTLLDECLDLCDAHVTEDDESSFSALQARHNVYTTKAANCIFMDQDSLALRYYQLLLATGERIFAIDTTKVQMLATDYFSIGNGYMSNDQYTEARLHFEKSMELMAKVPEEQVDLQTRMRVKGSLANIMVKSGKPEEAKEYQASSISDMEKLYHRNPVAYIYDLGLCKLQASYLFFQIAYHHNQPSEQERCLKYVDESISLFEQMAEKDPKAYNPIVEQLKESKADYVEKFKKSVNK